jgi:hypothetical protein
VKPIARKRRSSKLLSNKGGEAVGYVIFGLLLALATYPVWRLALFGVTIDDLLQLRCTSLPWR